MHTAQRWWKYHWLCCLYTHIHTHTHTHKQTKRKLWCTHSSLTGKISSSDSEQILTHAQAQNVQKHLERRAHTTSADYLAEHHVLHHRSRPPPHTPVPVSASVATTGPVSPCYAYRSCFWPPVKAYWATSPFPLLNPHFTLKLRFCFECVNLKML